MLHLDIKPANIFITDDNRAVLIDFGAARECCLKEQLHPPMHPGFAAGCTGAMPPWAMDRHLRHWRLHLRLHAGFPPPGATTHRERSALALAHKLRGITPDNLIGVVRWCMALDPLSRPQSVFALQKNSRARAAALHQTEHGGKMRLQLDTLVSDTRKTCKNSVKPRVSGTPAMKFSVFQSQPPGGREKRRPHGLLLHVVGPVCGGRWHGGPPW